MEVERTSIVCKNLRIEEIYRKKEDNLYYGIVRVAIFGEKIPEKFRVKRKFFGEELTENWGLLLYDPDGKPIRRVDKVIYAGYDLEIVKQMVEDVIRLELMELETYIGDNLGCDKYE